jgi:sarcosine oxidase subunit delta
MAGSRPRLLQVSSSPIFWRAISLIGRLRVSDWIASGVERQWTKRARAPNPTCIESETDAMRIACPFCGERELGEFTYLGDATPKRPSVFSIDGSQQQGALDAFYDYVYLRDNPAGEITEYWYHGGGCRSWLVARRNTTTHEVTTVGAASGAGAQRVEGARS